MRLCGESAEAFHQGLGQAGIVEELAVSWPDGARSTFADVPVNRLVTVHHPALEL